MMITTTQTENQVKPKAYQYIRWSSDPQTWGDSEHRQTKAARDYCEREGLEIQEASIDKGQSARHGDNRRNGNFAALMKIVKRGDFILLEDNDRFSREDPLTALMALKEIVSRGVTIVFVSSGLKVTEENFYEVGVLFQNFLKSFVANDENEKKSVRVRAGWQALKVGAAKGIIMTKATPAWFTADYATNKFTPVEPHITTLRRIFDSYANGKGIRTIMRELNEETVPTFGRGKQSKGSGWASTHLRRLLASRNVMGEYQPHRYIGKRKRVPDGPAIPNYYPAIIDPATFYRVQAILEQNGHPSGCRTRATNLFTGFIKCSTCGASLVIKRSPSQKGRYYYVSLICSAGARNASKCRYNSIQYDWVEKAVLTLLWSRVLPGLGERDETKDELIALEGELTSSQKAWAKLNDLLSDPDSISKAALEALKREETKQADLQSRIEMLTARAETKPLIGWKQVPKTLENRLRVQSILREEIEAVTLDLKSLRGTLKVRDPEVELDLQWARGDSRTFQSVGKTFHYLDDVLVWETERNEDLETLCIKLDKPYEEAA